MFKLQKGLDKSLLLAIFSLLGIGLVQVYSSSFIFAIESRGDGLFFFKRQLAFVIVAVFVLLLTAHLPWRWFEKWGSVIWFGAAVGVLATYLPGFGLRAGGATRWLHLPGGMVFEPSELLRISFPLLLATFVARRQTSWGKWEWPLRLAAVIIPLALVYKQPDFGSLFICSMVLFSVLFAFGLSWKAMLGGACTALPIFYFMVMRVPFRRARIEAFLDPWSDPGQKGFQVIQSMLSFSSGGLTGSGLGQGQGKLFFLPEAHTDFTLAVLGEEMGFIGFVAVLSLYGYLVLKGLRLAARCEDRFARAASLGLTLTFAYSVFINVGVVIGLLPTKGLTLPFLSYGGSSLVMSCFLFGLLLNIDAHERVTLPSGARASRFQR